MNAEQLRETRGDGIGALRADFPAAARHLADVRHRLADWLDRVVPDPRRAYDLLLAAGEACTNAVEHGHHSDQRPIRLEAAVHGDTVCITISDNGHWVPPADLAAGTGPTLRGRGLAMIEALVPHSRITVGEHGTTVELRAPLHAG